MSSTVFASRFGSLCNAANDLTLQFVTGLNFDTGGPDSDSNLNPTPNGGCAARQPANTKWGWNLDFQLALYSSANLNGYTTQPVMDLNAFTNNKFFNKNTSSNEGLEDVYGPYWNNFATNYTAHAGPKNNYRSPHFWGFNGTITDVTKIPTGGWEFNAVAGQSGTGVDPAIQVLLSSPLATGKTCCHTRSYSAGPLYLPRSGKLF